MPTFDFPISLNHLLVDLEGLVFTDSPSDLGGGTRNGVTQATYDGYRSAHNLPTQSVDLITMAETSDIYLNGYWTPASCDQIPNLVNFVHFQWAVNHGIAGSTKTLQLAVGAIADGVLGPVTLGKVNAQDPITTCKNYLSHQYEWYLNFVESNSSQEANLKGWRNRTIKTMNIVLGLPVDQGTVA